MSSNKNIYFFMKTKTVLHGVIAMCAITMMFALTSCNGCRHKNECSIHGHKHYNDGCIHHDNVKYVNGKKQVIVDTIVKEHYIVEKASHKPYERAHYVRNSGSKHRYVKNTHFTVRKSKGLTHYVDYQTAIDIAEQCKLRITKGKRWRKHVISPRTARRTDYRRDGVWIEVHPGDTFAFRNGRWRMTRY